jgi:hypothetical protein
MACTDGKNTYLNIKELPEINDVINGDFMIIETPSGTSIIDYQNFLVTLDNTTFGDLITQNTTDIATLSTSFSTLSSELTADIASLSATTARTNTFVVFSLLNYNLTTSPVILKSSNIKSVTLATTTSAITIEYITNFNDVNYCITTGVTNSTPVLVHNTLTTTNTATFNILSAARLSSFSTADKVSIQIINA